MQQNSSTAIFGGGCFWCTEAVFASLKGVTRVEPGYAGGGAEHPTYDQVSSGTTGHAEVIKIEFDPSAISYRTLLTVFFGTHDPTTLNRQGNDVGTQYRSVIFPTDDEQKEEAEAAIAEAQKELSAGSKVVTTIEPLTNYATAEDYHKRYYEAHKDQQYCQIVIESKLAKLKRRFSALLAKA